MVVSFGGGGLLIFNFNKILYKIYPEKFVLNFGI